jgi:hypothetical protein
MSLISKLVSAFSNNEKPSDDEDIGDMSGGRGQSILGVDPSSLAHAAYDGITHINVDMRGKTVLGRMMAHSWNDTFHHPRLGPFNSMDGFWGYIKTGKKHDSFRYMTAQDARARLKEMMKDKSNHLIVPDFYQTIIEADYYKFCSDQKIVQLLKSTIEPFDMYYVYQTTDTSAESLLIRPQPSETLIAGFEYIRDLIQHDKNWDSKEFLEYMTKNGINLE